MTESIRKNYLAVLFFFVFIFSSTSLWSRVAVLPYRVAATSERLTEDAGRDYARLVSLTLRVSKNINVAEFRNITSDLYRDRIDCRKKITAEDLNRFGLRGHYEYLLMGTLSQKKGEIQSKSLLYSVREKRVLIRFRSSASTLPALARKDIREAFSAYRDRVFETKHGSLDLLIMADMSANMLREWPSLRRDLKKIAGRLIDIAGIDTRIYFLPISKKHSYRDTAYFDNSLLLFNKYLNSINPRGATDGNEIQASLSYAIKNIRWRRDSKKQIIIISNSSLKGRGYPEQYGIEARNRGIRINGLLLGKLNHESGESLTRLVQSSGGELRYLGYRQRVYDAEGTGHWVYFERGRMLESEEHDILWRDGILEMNKYRPGHGRPRISASELFSDVPPKDPYDLPERYDRMSGKRIFRSEKLQNNLIFSLTGIFEKNGIVFSGGK